MNIPVSVIIPTFNRAFILKKAIDSVINQSHRHIELIVVDDGSTDGTTDLISQYGRQQLRYFHQPNSGPGAARNRGIAEASHDYLAFLDSDDTFAREKITLQLAMMEKHPQYLISHTQEIWFRRDKILNQKKKHQKCSGNIFAQALTLCCVGMSTIMARRTLFEEVGLFDKTLPCCEDYDLWLRTSVRHPFLLIDSPLTIKDGGRDDQVSVIHRVGMDRFRITSIKKALDSGLLSKEQDGLARDELTKKCRIYGSGCLKHGRHDEAAFHFTLAEHYAPRG